MKVDTSKKKVNNKTSNINSIQKIGRKIQIFKDLLPESSNLGKFAKILMQW